MMAVIKRYGKDENGKAKYEIAKDMPRHDTSGWIL